MASWMCLIERGMLRSLRAYAAGFTNPLLGHAALVRVLCSEMHCHAGSWTPGYQQELLEVAPKHVLLH